MDKQLAAELRDCLPSGRTKFQYFKDRYAFVLLGYAAREPITVARLKAGPFAPLLARPAVREVLARHGRVVVDRATFRDVWLDETEPFLLTLGEWGGTNRFCAQTSRPGVNLVLRLNFTSKHDRPYRRLVGEGTERAFNNRAHPVLHRRADGFFRETLAWARIDLDLVTGEALIEEVQSDWVRYVRYRIDSLARRRARARGRRVAILHDELARLRIYARVVLAPYEAIWQEGMLAAAIGFVREEIGLATIYFHTWETGIASKRMQSWPPPRSTYSRLPRRFCFVECDEPPRFLARSRGYRRRLRGLARPTWYHMEL